METIKKNIPKVWLKAHAVIQFVKFGGWYIIDFALPKTDDESNILKVLHEEVKSIRRHEIDFDHNPWYKLNRLPEYWIHLLEVDNTPRLRSSIIGRVTNGVPWNERQELSLEDWNVKEPESYNGIVFAKRR